LQANEQDIKISINQTQSQSQYSMPHGRRRVVTPLTRVWAKAEANVTARRSNVSRRAKVTPVWSLSTCGTKRLLAASNLFVPQVLIDNDSPTDLFIYSVHHRRRKRGVCRGSDTPNYICGGYWYVYHPRKT